MATKKKVSAPAAEIIKGFKVADPDGKCRGMQYEAGKEYTLPNSPVLCGQGLHFCQVANNCFEYYSFDTKNKVFEVEAFGETVHGHDKSATNGLRIVREMTWHEVLSAVNSGANNTGRGNSGNRNSGNLNSGDRNSGNLNSGDLNSGNLNSGDRNSGYLNSGNLNSGDLNSGNLNSGDRNSGNLNSGDRNSGYLNSGDRNSGIFCTTTPKNIELFNKPSGWSLQDFLDSEAYYLTQRLQLTEWRAWSDMTDAEKEQFPRAETSEGYTKKHEYKTAWRALWASFGFREQAAITGLPNFDKSVFEAITGVSL